MFAESVPDVVSNPHQIRVFDDPLLSSVASLFDIQKLIDNSLVRQVGTVRREPEKFG